MTRTVCQTLSRIRIESLDEFARSSARQCMSVIRRSIDGVNSHVSSDVCVQEFVRLLKPRHEKTCNEGRREAMSTGVQRKLCVYLAIHTCRVTMTIYER